MSQCSQRGPGGHQHKLYMSRWLSTNTVSRFRHVTTTLICIAHVHMTNHVLRFQTISLKSRSPVLKQITIQFSRQLFRFIDQIIWRGTNWNCVVEAISINVSPQDLIEKYKSYNETNLLNICGYICINWRSYTLPVHLTCGPCALEPIGRVKVTLGSSRIKTTV